MQGTLSEEGASSRDGTSLISGRSHDGCHMIITNHMTLYYHVTWIFPVLSACAPSGEQRCLIYHNRVILARYAWSLFIVRRDMVVIYRKTHWRRWTLQSTDKRQSENTSLIYRNISPRMSEMITKIIAAIQASIVVRWRGWVKNDGIQHTRDEWTSIHNVNNGMTI